MLSRRQFVLAACALPAALPFAGLARAEPAAAADAAAVEPWAAALIAAARAQIGVTTIYDGSYARIAYPMGDVPRERGVCCDVVIRAYRDALARDLQQSVHEDMRAHFSKYPRLWGLTRTDSNIDHRRVPNLMTFLARAGAAVDGDEEPRPGDLVTMIVPPNLPHIAIVSDARSADGKRPLIVHNIGAGTREEDRLEEFVRSGHYRWPG